ncbi:transcription factor VIP1 [Eucalyptus grandis]|nr:transcription factor VIP1 [Eucalyptus grandis]
MAASSAAAAAMDIIEQMPDTPQRHASHHRRAHSDTTFRLDDFLLFDASDLDLSGLDLPSSSAATTPTPSRGGGAVPGAASAAAATSMAVDSEDSSSKPSPPINHFRSLSVDSDFFDGLSLTGAGGGAGGDERFGAKSASAASERRAFHRHSNSMDGSSSASFELDSLMMSDAAKKAMAPDRLAELALIDPKRAKRILANRQSAARSKERKIRYTNELERKVQTLQTEATTLSAQVTLLQRDTTGLTAENKELKLRLQAMEQQAQLRDALNEALKEEVQRLKIAAGQMPAVNGAPFGGPIPQFSARQPPLHQFGGGPNRHQQQQQQQQHMQQSSTNGQTRNGQPHPSFLDFNPRIQ